jgi:hypothetical protein
MSSYGISAVRYNSAHTHITDVRVRVRTGNSFGTTVSTWTRKQVVDAIKRNDTFVTTRIRAGVYVVGEDVRIFPVNGVEYLRTDNNRTAADNLGELPEF